jgi:hypothetical protein
MLVLLKCNIHLHLVYIQGVQVSTYFNTILFIVKNSGNVDIGTMNPSYLLDFNGIVNLSSTLNVVGTSKQD